MLSYSQMILTPSNLHTCIQQHQIWSVSILIPSNVHNLHSHTPKSLKLYSLQLEYPSMHSTDSNHHSNTSNMHLSITNTESTLTITLALLLWTLCEWVHNLLKHNKTRDHIAQADIHTQRHMNNAWSEMVTLIPCLDLYCTFLPWFIQCMWNMSTPTFPQTIWVYSNLIHY